VSRFAAYAIDLAVSSAVFSLALAAISYGVHVVTGHEVSWNRSSPVVAVLFVIWQFVYFGYSWAVAGRTFGMAVLGIRVVRADGSVVAPRQGVVRALVFRPAPAALPRGEHQAGRRSAAARPGRTAGRLTRSRPIGDRKVSPRPG
jgi:uncharacterized RDD family membrane protein YckC